MSSRHHPSTRPQGLDRLRRVTAGVAVTSAIATGGFAILAAATFRGTARAATPQDPASGSAGQADQGQSVPQVTGRQPRTNGFGLPGDSSGQVPTVPGRSSGRGHVSTGSS
jgi:hypothetical protein